MKACRVIIILVLLVGVSACNWFDTSTVAQTPRGISDYQGTKTPTFWSAFPTFFTEEPWSPEPTPTILIPTPTQTPLPIPPVEEYYQRFVDEIDPLVTRLAAVSLAPSNFILPAVEERQILFIPEDERLYYVQSLLYPELLIGDSSASTRLFIAYSYDRGGTLCESGIVNCTEAMHVAVRLYTEINGELWFVQEMPFTGNGEGASSNGDIPSHAIVPLTSLGDKATQVEEILETIVGFTVGANLDEGASAHVNPTVQIRVAILRQALTSIFKSDKVDAADSLAELGSEAAPAIPELMTSLSDKENWVRIRAAHALGHIGSAAGVAVPLLVDLLDDVESLDWREVVIIITTIGDIGPGAAPAVEDLIPFLTDESEYIRKAAAYALGQIGQAASEAVPFLIDALNKDSDGGVQSEIIQALGKIGPVAAAAIPDLILIVEGGGNLVDEAIIALGNMGEAATVAVPVIIPYVYDEDCIRATTEALGKIGPAAIDAVPAFIDALRNQNYWFLYPDISETLTSITEQNFGENPDQWQAWWDQNKP
jgi:HEAT repeat protein